MNKFERWEEGIDDSDSVGIGAYLFVLLVGFSIVLYWILSNLNTAVIICK